MSIGQEPPDPEASESGRLSPPAEEPPLTKQPAIANEFAADREEGIARKLHEQSIFATGHDGTSWEKVDPVYRQRRLFQAHDLATLGYVQRTNYYFGFEDLAKALED
jgi:hypothetical protein